MQIKIQKVIIVSFLFVLVFSFGKYKLIENKFLAESVKKYLLVEDNIKRRLLLVR